MDARCLLVSRWPARKYLYLSTSMIDVVLVGIHCHWHWHYLVVSPLPTSARTSWTQIVAEPPTCNKSTTTTTTTTTTETEPQVVPQTLVIERADEVVRVAQAVLEKSEGIYARGRTSG